MIDITQESLDRVELRSLFCSIVDVLDLLQKHHVWDEDLANAVNVVDQSFAHLRDRWNAEEKARLARIFEALKSTNGGLPKD